LAVSSGTPWPTATSVARSSSASRNAVLAPSPRPGDMVWIASPSRVTRGASHPDTVRAVEIATNAVPSTSDSSMMRPTAGCQPCTADLASSTSSTGEAVAGNGAEVNDSIQDR
jgi:hypothetical protein